MGADSRSSTRARARDLARLAVRYGWSLEEVVRVKAQLKDHPEAMNRYWRNLAIAYAAGFVQSEESGLPTLSTWCARSGRPDPTLSDLDDQ